SWCKEKPRRDEENEDHEGLFGSVPFVFFGSSWCRFATSTLWNGNHHAFGAGDDREVRTRLIPVSDDELLASAEIRGHRAPAVDVGDEPARPLPAVVNGDHPQRDAANASAVRVDDPPRE